MAKFDNSEEANFYANTFNAKALDDIRHYAQLAGELLQDGIERQHKEGNFDTKEAFERADAFTQLARYVERVMSYQDQD